MNSRESDVNKKLSVVILNWNGQKLLEEFLPNVVYNTNSPEVELIVADNGSTDDSVKWIENNFPGVRIIRFNHNYGFAEGYNRALEQIETPFAILLNSDVSVVENWWKPMLEFMEKNPDVAAVQPKIKSYINKDSFEYAGAAGGFLDRLGYPYCRGRLFDKVEKDLGQYDGSHIDVAWASGAALMVRTSVYLELGGLDPLFFAHMEEIDLCCRMWNAGYRVCAISDSEVYHLGGGTLGYNNPKKTYLNFRNNLLVLYKNLPKRGRGKKLFVRRLVDTFAFLMYLLKFDIKNAGSVFRAHRDFRKMKKQYKNGDYIVDEKRFPMSKRLIVADRFLFNRKK